VPNEKRGRKRKRSSGRRKAPTAEEKEAQAECEDTGSSQPPATKRPDVETEVPSSATSPERQRTSTCTALREYTGPKGSRSKDAPVTRSGRVSKPPTWFGDYVYIAYENTNPDEEIGSLPPGWKKARAEVQHALAHELILAWWEDHCCLSTGEFMEPDTLEEAMEGEHSKQWKKATNDEFDSLMHNDTWELVPRKKNMKVLQNRWIFRVKYHANGEVERFKARLVIKGFMQIYGIDYLEVYSPVVRLETLRVLLTLAAVWDYEVHQMDAMTVFLNGKIDVEVYMEQPEGYKVKGKEDWVCRLKKSLYGLKQAPRVWFQLLKMFLEEQGFTMLQSEACVAVKVIDGQLVFIPLYVDDLILFAPSMELINKMKQMFHDRFAMKDLGELHYIWAGRSRGIAQRGQCSLARRGMLRRCSGDSIWKVAMAAKLRALQT